MTDGSGYVWTDDLIGDFLVFQPNDNNNFCYYPAQVLGISNTGQVILEWYTGNIYARNEKPIEKQFTASREQCAQIYAAGPDLNYSKDNIGKLKWPHRLAEDATQNYPNDFSNPAISNILNSARDDVLAIVLGTRQHPIQSDYVEWRFESKRPEAHANAFLTNFHANLLPGDTTLIEPHAAFVLQLALRDIAATAEAQFLFLRIHVFERLR
ncbi:hypothetical protein C8J57DRAFT_1517649 [Mycena rebaudengoi]|nr:hypothetical protein C8J57DRAFT_1517649 [Mycena rebaudengoi]